ncbi:helix-turn-helix domain-containing protein [Myroides injenensis]|uniref:helix-turn-helix domain-containing protein n=1 Tax=Myroides injenensis TaxID=1183151 RepID=UPI002271F56F|nr:helix-turn-helix domain-containing protein [Myroides injenensis]
MTLKKAEFISWMERLVIRIDSLKEHIVNLELQTLNIDGEELLDNQDIMKILKISYRSLQRYRSERRLPYYKLRGKVYYKLSDVQQLLRETFSSPVR